MYFLPRKMANSSFDVIAGAVAEEQYKKSTWFNEPSVFARSERRCVRVTQRQCDKSLQETAHAFKNVLALMVGKINSSRFGFYKLWEADFVRRLLGFTTGLEENTFNQTSQHEYHLCSVAGLLTQKVGKVFTAFLGPGGLGKDEMLPNGAVVLGRLFDCLGNRVHPLH